MPPRAWVGLLASAVVGSLTLAVASHFLLQASLPGPGLFTAEFALVLWLPSFLGALVVAGLIGAPIYWAFAKRARVTARACTLCATAVAALAGVFASVLLGASSLREAIPFTVVFAVAGYLAGFILWLAVRHLHWQTSEA
jgi:hypothetical protein